MSAQLYRSNLVQSGEMDHSLPPLAPQEDSYATSHANLIQLSWSSWCVPKLSDFVCPLKAQACVFALYKKSGLGDTYFHFSPFLSEVVSSA